VELLRRVALVLAAAAIASPSARAEEPAIERVTPLRAEDVVAADIATSGLPGETLETSLRSGLPSAIELRLEALDARDRPRGETRLFYRIAWDLWDELFRVEGPGVGVMPGEVASRAPGPTHRFADVAALRSFLGSLPQLPVTAYGSLDPTARHRVRVGGRLHRVAPRETARLERWVAGRDVSRATADPDGREVSVGLGEVIRFFYKGSKRDADEMAERFSAWFVPAELPNGTEAATSRSPGDGEASE
jgi:hypothetical protein